MAMPYLNPSIMWESCVHNGNLKAFSRSVKMQPTSSSLTARSSQSPSVSSFFGRSLLEGVEQLRLYSKLVGSLSKVHEEPSEH